MGKKPARAMDRAVIYLRVSTEDQARSGLGREAQESKCREHCARAGLDVIAVFVDDGFSGRLPLARRPGLAAAVGAVQANTKTAFVVYAVSRFVRTQRELWTLVDERGEYGLPLASATEPFDLTTPMGRAFLGMIATFATLEADLTSERTRDALAAARARGTRLGAPSMIEGPGRTADPDRVAIVRRVQELYAAGGLSHRALADRLNEEGVPTAKGGRWHAKTVRTALGLDVGGKG